MAVQPAVISWHIFPQINCDLAANTNTHSYIVVVIVIVDLVLSGMASVCQMVAHHIQSDSDC
jgi:hypothetical protein